MDALRILFYFTLLIGPLVLFHELGHFLTARFFGVKCIEFSIGFGPKIFSWKPSETTYSFRLLPLGGFVRMLDSHDTASQEEDSPGRAITDKALWKRALILAAGPLVNLLLPIPVFFIFLMLAPGVLPPIIGTVEPGLPAAEAGLQAGDRIIAINGKSTATFEDVQRKVSNSANKTLTVDVDRYSETKTITLSPSAFKRRNPMLPMRIQSRGIIGIHLTQYGPVVTPTTPDSLAAQVGFQPFDQIERIDGIPVSYWPDVVAALDGQRPHTIDVLRQERTVDAWADVRLRYPRTLEVPAGTTETLGLASAQRSIWSIVPGSPADQADLQPGDQILEMDGNPQADLSWILSRLSVEPDQDHELKILRNGVTTTHTIHPKTKQVVAEFRSQREHVFIGIQSYQAFKYPPLEKLPLGKRFVHAISTAIRDTANVAGSLVVGVGMLFTGQMDTNSVGGPLMIADVASQAARLGIERFLSIMALISVNLGVLNLLPIPGLDGGQLAVVGLEAANRGPLSPRTRQMIQFIGIAMLILLMLFVFKNDVERYWRVFADWLNA